MIAREERKLEEDTVRWWCARVLVPGRRELAFTDSYFSCSFEKTESAFRSFGIKLSQILHCLPQGFVPPHGTRPLTVRNPCYPARHTTLAKSATYPERHLSFCVCLWWPGTAEMTLACDFIVIPHRHFLRKCGTQAGRLIRRVNHIPCYLCLAIEREQSCLILLDALPS